MLHKQIYTLVVVLLASTLITSKVIAQTVEESLMETFQSFDTAKNYNQQVPVVNQFRMIAMNYPDNWLCNYYASFSIAILSFTEPDAKKRDPMLDDADAYFEKIKALTDNNEEVNILGALLAQARIAVKGSRYKKYGDMSKAFIDKATALNSNCPRIYYLQGSSIYYTPKMFGGGAKNALPLFEKAATLFAAEQKTDITKPFWGNTRNKMLIDTCKVEISK